MGARLVLIARDRARGEAALRRLRAVAPSAAHRVLYADLTLIADVKRVAAEIASQAVVTSSSAGRAPPARQAEDDNAAKRLWRESASSPASNEGDAGMRRGTVQVARRDHGRS